MRLGFEQSPRKLVLESKHAWTIANRSFAGGYCLVRVEQIPIKTIHHLLFIVGTCRQSITVVNRSL